jgi:hypothetical protein
VVKGRVQGQAFIKLKNLWVPDDELSNYEFFDKHLVSWSLLKVKMLAYS